MNSIISSFTNIFCCCSARSHPNENDSSKEKEIVTEKTVDELVSAFVVELMQKPSRRESSLLLYLDSEEE